MASNYSDPLLYRLEDYKELTCDLPNFKFGLQPMRTNYIFITPGCKPVIQRFCIIEGLWPDSPKIWLHLLVRAPLTPLITVIPLYDFFPYRGISERKKELIEGSDEDSIMINR